MLSLSLINAIKSIKVEAPKLWPPPLPPFKITYKIHEHSFAQSDDTWFFKQMFFHTILPNNLGLEIKDA